MEERKKKYAGIVKVNLLHNTRVVWVSSCRKFVRGLIIGNQGGDVPQCGITASRTSVQAVTGSSKNLAVAAEEPPYQKIKRNLHD